MRPSSYKERDYAFGQMMLLLRTSLELTQIEIAEILGVSRKAVGRWEAGEMYPKLPHLKALLTFALEQHAFTSGREEEEIRAFWKAAHQKTQLDERWLHDLFAAWQARQTLEKARDVELTHPLPVRGVPRIDWGEALDVSRFYGREEELAQLHEWVVQERCRIVCLLGMGGIGKSALTVRCMHRVASDFDVVIWRSLRDAPSCEVLLDECLQLLAPQPLHDPSSALERQLSRLLDLFHQFRVLLVLDNLETLLQEGSSTGRMRPGYEGYERLLQRIGGSDHQSCLLLTSREKPADLLPLEGGRNPVRALRLRGLGDDAGQLLLEARELRGSAQEQRRLVEAYGGNPLALNIIAQSVVDVFGGEIAAFLNQGEVVFGSVRELLDEQFRRLSHVEQSVLFWLAIVREPISLEELKALFVNTPQPHVQVLEAVTGLRRRSLIELGQRAGSFTLQAVVLEYATMLLIGEASREIKQQRLVRLIEHGLTLSTSREYVRRSQMRLIVNPLLVELRSTYLERAAVEEQLLTLLEQLRNQADYAQGYGPANILMLLCEQRQHLRGLDLSQLAIRGALLRGVEMQDTSLAGSILQDTVFTEAFDAIRSIAISPDGTLWAASSRQGNVRMWYEGGKRLYRTWHAHSDTIRALVFSPDGSTLATGSWDGAIKLWQIESGDLLWASWQTNNIQRLAYAPDGCMLASCGDDGTVRIWDAKSGECLQSSSSQRGPMHALAWSPDGRLLASGSFDGSLRLWEWSHGIVRVLAEHKNWVTGLAFAPDGHTLASASFDRTVRLWDVTSGKVRNTLSGHTGPVFSVAYSQNGHLLASSGFDRTIQIWDSELGSYRMALREHTAAVYDVAFTPDSRHLLSGGDDGALRLWDVAIGRCLQIKQSYAISLYDIAWNFDGTWLASAGSDTLVSIWDAKGQLPPRVFSGHRWIVRGVVWSPDGQYVASCGEDNALRIWELDTGETKHLLRDPDGVDTSFYGVAWSPDGQWLAAASYQQGVHVWQVTDATRRWVSRTQQTRIRNVGWSPDGQWLASCGDDGSVFLWRAFDDSQGIVLRGHRGMAMSLAWSPDGTQLVSGGGGSGSGEIIFWDVLQRERLHVWSEAGTMVYALAWSATGDLLISGGSDGSIRWWEVASGKCLKVQKKHQGAVQSLRMSSDNRMLASCSDDGAIHISNVYTGEHIRTLRRDRPYERLNIRDVRGVSEAHKENLRALGAIG
ncbi:hypothetical protein KDA_54070 [Dictyobacter alpinus]|uniref:HTH cro/C1-type domain-containing protein n=1 Tax=Dictyobacter alpinus TaxID=2014873 RepID=A0A402BEW5_9CHLR|nr:AAA family ATPase [Dictyobacter alpinus]GCE29923.1 hypothetical protein KDA_54070 [Dictyobacter alpinus]